LLPFSPQELQKMGKTKEMAEKHVERYPKYVKSRNTGECRLIETHSENVYFLDTRTAVWKPAEHVLRLTV
jgi:hypothetical protein